MRVWLGVWLALCLALLTACAYKSDTFRYRLTVEVETPQGLRTGSSVIEVELSQPRDSARTLPQARKILREFRGEAVAVDLPGGRTLFALLRGEDGSDASTILSMLSKRRSSPASSPAWSVSTI